MGKKRLLRWATPVALLSLSGAALWFGCAATGPRPGRDTFARVELGMTLDQVSATVGGPPGSYRTDESAVLPHGHWRLWQHTAWVSNEAVLFVRFDDGAAVDVRVLGMEHNTGPGLWERVRDRLGIFQPPPPPPRPPRLPDALPPELE